MGKLIFFVLLVAIGWIAYKGWRKAAGAASPRPAPAAEDMVRCAHCGVHLPRSESVAAGADLFCSEEHRRLRR
jgi:uncharacterized protein